MCDASDQTLRKKKDKLVVVAHVLQKTQDLGHLALLFCRERLQNT